MHKIARVITEVRTKLCLYMSYITVCQPIMSVIVACLLFLFMVGRMLHGYINVKLM